MLGVNTCTNIIKIGVNTLTSSLSKIQMKLTLKMHSVFRNKHIMGNNVTQIKVTNKSITQMYLHIYTAAAKTKYIK